MPARSPSGQRRPGRLDPRAVAIVSIRRTTRPRPRRGQCGRRGEPAAGAPADRRRTATRSPSASGECPTAARCAWTASRYLPGDRLEPEQLAKLTYDTGTAAVGSTEQLCSRWTMAAAARRPSRYRSAWLPPEKPRRRHRLAAAASGGGATPSLQRRHHRPPTPAPAEPAASAPELPASRPSA